MAYEAQGVTFDGLNDYLTRGADLTNNADTKQVTCSFWLNRTGTGKIQNVYTSQLLVGSIQIEDDDTLSVNFRNSATVAIANFASTNAVATGWHHIMFSFDLTDSAKRHVFFDGAAMAGSWTVFTNDTIDATRGEHAIGAQPDGSNELDGDLADFWFDYGLYLDLGVQANREKFYGPNGGAVDLGSDGSLPTGNAPIMFFHDQTSTWHTNDGTGGGFTNNGALTNAASNPPTEPDGVNVAALAMHYARLQRVSPW